MVRKGEFLERSVVVSGLDALYHRGPVTPACLLASPHPALGGSMTSTVIGELAWALTRAGHATMRFDYRGVGASQGELRHPAGEMPFLTAESLAGEREDFFTVGDQLLATTQQSALCAVGYSFGAAVALSAIEDARVERLVLIAPPTSLYDFKPLGAVHKPLLVVAGHHDTFTDRAALQSMLPSHARFEVIAHADHSFRRGLTELGKVVARWLRGERAEFVAPPDSEDSSEVREIELDPGDDAPLELDTDP